jgi:hypothetical protein
LSLNQLASKDANSIYKGKTRNLRVTNKSKRVIRVRIKWGNALLLSSFSHGRVYSPNSPLLEE